MCEVVNTLCQVGPTGRWPRATQERSRRQHFKACQRRGQRSRSTFEDPRDRIEPPRIARNSLAMAKRAGEHLWGEGRTLPEAGVANRGGLGLGPVPGARDPRGNWTLRAAAEAGPCWGLAGGRSHCQRVRGPRGNWEGPRFPALASWVGPAGALERPWGELAREGSSPAEAGSRWPGPARPPRPL
ncbi:uncharacterized protein LOC123381900 isoform X2 [Felis catus]|uniref:uncharacterized protein LOC123381900 isoform X2 n=1 Tax=Felis catus TaxID=9685 RepID=UPI001D19E8B9|nr:uncharacterized protein LOC123381900 isoform X2 [Felis catus]